MKAASSILRQSQIWTPIDKELTCERTIRVQGLVQPIFGITFHPQFNEFSKTRCVRDQLSQRCRNMRSDLRSRWNFQ
jgi:hypothetical protein